MYGYLEISECIGYSLRKTILCFCQSFRIWLFILIIDPLAHGNVFFGIYQQGRGLLPVFAD